MLDRCLGGGTPPPAKSPLHRTHGALAPRACVGVRLANEDCGVRTRPSMTDDYLCSPPMICSRIARSILKDEMGLGPWLVYSFCIFACNLLQPLCDERGRGRSRRRATEWARRRSSHGGRWEDGVVYQRRLVGVGRARENRCLERLQRASPKPGTWHRAKRTECPRTR